MQPDGNDFLMGSGAPSVSWKYAPVGTRVEGEVTAPPQTRQQTDYYSKELKFYKNGDPMMQSVIRFRTSLRDAGIEHDDGERCLYVRGKNIKSLRDAIRKTGAKGLEIGGHLSATFVGEEPTEGEPRKVLEFVYRRPSSIEAPTAVITSPTHVNTPATSVSATGTATNLTPQQIADLKAMGINL